MTLPHLINLVIHVSAGVAAMSIGFYILAKIKGTNTHRKFGKIFCLCGLVVCGAAAFGLTVFRFLPLFAIITLLVAYQLVGGWRVIYTRGHGPAIYDAVLTILTAMLALLLAPIVLGQVTGTSVIALSTFSALGLVLFYDSIRWVFPRSWHRVLWRYEHAYKLLSALFGMLSSFVGNTVRVGQPWSQIMPSVLGVICIGYFFVKLYRYDRQGFAKSVTQNKRFGV